MSIDADLLEKLACPKCRGAVRMAGGGAGLSCAACGLFYEIRDGIPVMIVELARPLAEVPGAGGAHP